MRKLLFYSVLFLITSSLYAQLGVYNSETSENMVGDTITFWHAIDTTSPYPYYEHKGFVNVINESNDTIGVRVQREEIDYIDGTFDYFCWGVCHDTVRAGTRKTWAPPVVVTMDPGDTAIGDNDLSVYLKPENKVGEALYKYTFVDTSNLLPTGPSIYIRFSLTYLTSIGEHKNTNVSFNLYPNPANNQVTLDFDKGFNQNLSIEIKDILGKQIETLAVNASAKKLKLDLSSYSKGIYFISVLDNQQRVKTKKLIVK